MHIQFVTGKHTTVVFDLSQKRKALHSLEAMQVGG